MKNKNVIDDITEYDAIYRSDGPGYVRFRKYFLKKFEHQLNPKFRENTYLPLRILLLETTRSKTKYSLNDLWLLLHSRRFKAPSILSISVSDSEIIPWNQMCAAMTAPGPVSFIRCTPFSRERFAFSTIDGSIHFATTANSQLRIISSVSIPGVSFFKFDWVSETLVVGIGVTSSLFFLSSDSRIFELPMPSPPSEVSRFSNSSSIVVVGDRSGLLYSLDLSDLNQPHSADPTQITFKQPTSATISKIDPSVNKFHNSKKPITALCVPQSGECIICGTSDGEIDVVFVEQKTVRGWKGTRSELKMKSAVHIPMNSLLNTKPASVDALSTVHTKQGDFIFVNLRSEFAALLISEDEYKSVILKKSVRVPSMRARCPAALTAVGDEWIWVAGTDMGDLILQEQGEEQNILTLHETAIASVEWCPNQKKFLAADVSGLISLWTKIEV